MKLEIGQESTVVDVQASDVQVNTEQATVQGVLNSSQIENSSGQWPELPRSGPAGTGRPDPGRRRISIRPKWAIRRSHSADVSAVRRASGRRRRRQRRDRRHDDRGHPSQRHSGIRGLAQSTLDLSNELTSSGAVNVTTKAGTNSYHGEAFGILPRQYGGWRQAATCRMRHDLCPRPYYQRNQEGGSVRRSHPERQVVLLRGWRAHSAALRPRRCRKPPLMTVTRALSGAVSLRRNSRAPGLQPD